LPTDELYREIQRTVAEADFEGMANTYHPDAVVVTTELTHPVADVIERWKTEGEAFAREGGEANVDFRFSSRLTGEGTAFDTGIFRYSTIDTDGTRTVYYTHFENLAIQKDGVWQTMMEHQVNKATESEWDQLPTWPVKDE
jgi:ketosteroid isomerase-like protein